MIPFVYHGKPLQEPSVSMQVMWGSFTFICGRYLACITARMQRRLHSHKWFLFRTYHRGNSGSSFGLLDYICLVPTKLKLDWPWINLEVLNPIHPKDFWNQKFVRDGFFLPRSARIFRDSCAWSFRASAYSRYSEGPCLCRWPDIKMLMIVATKVR